MGLVSELGQHPLPRLAVENPKKSCDICAHGVHVKLTFKDMQEGMTSPDQIMAMAAFIREVEIAIAERYARGAMRCPVHLSIGQELSAALVCHYLRPTDWVFSTHRCHAHYLAKGGDLIAMLAELHGKQGGCCKGRGGSMHLYSAEARVFAGPIVGSMLSPALGVAWSFKQREDDNIVVAFLGDAVIEQGIFHECLLIAKNYSLPVLFVAENNGVSVETANVKRRGIGVRQLAEAHGLTFICYDVRHKVDDIAKSTGAFFEAIRLPGIGPRILELVVDRKAEHCGPAFMIPDNDLLPRSLGENRERIEAAFAAVEAMPDATMYEEFTSHDDVR